VPLTPVRRWTNPSRPSSLISSSVPLLTVSGQIELAALDRIILGELLRSGQASRQVVVCRSFRETQRKPFS